MPKLARRHVQVYRTAIWRNALTVVRTMKWDEELTDLAEYRYQDSDLLSLVT
jgi:hypothetical protein